MKRWFKVVFCVLFSFLFCFMCIGYAEVSDVLTISGGVELQEPKQVYITRIVSTTGTVDHADTVPYTSINSSITLGSSASSVVTMTVEVKNNTNVRYGFNSIRFTSEAYSNPNIIVATNMTRKTVDSKGNITDNGTIIEPGQTITFVATFSYDEGKTSPSTLDSIINYEFLPWTDITADIDVGLASDVMGQFKNILNNEVAPDSYKQLKDQMADNQTADRIYDDYIANFDDAYYLDKEVLTNLFGADMMFVHLNDKEVEVKVMIKEKNVTDKYAGDEMVLYMTTHNLQRSGFISYASPIYAAVFANNGTEWIQIGDMYTGRGRINGYDGGYFSSGSFDTESWVSTQDYGSAKSGSSINQIIATLN